MSRNSPSFYYNHAQVRAKCPSSTTRDSAIEERSAVLDIERGTDCRAFARSIGRPTPPILATNPGATSKERQFQISRNSGSPTRLTSSARMGYPPRQRWAPVPTAPSLRSPINPPRHRFLAQRSTGKPSMALVPGPSSAKAPRQLWRALFTIRTRSLSPLRISASPRRAILSTPSNWLGPNPAEAVIHSLNEAALSGQNIVSISLLGQGSPLRYQLKTRRIAHSVAAAEKLVTVPTRSRSNSRSPPAVRVP